MVVCVEVTQNKETVLRHFFQDLQNLSGRAHEQCDADCEIKGKQGSPSCAFGDVDTREPTWFLAMANNVWREFVDEKSLDEAQEQFDVLYEPYFLHSVSGETKYLPNHKETCHRRS